MSLLDGEVGAECVLGEEGEEAVLEVAVLLSVEEGDVVLAQQQLRVGVQDERHARADALEHLAHHVGVRRQHEVLPHDAVATQRTQRHLLVPERVRRTHHRHDAAEEGDDPGGAGQSALLVRVRQLLVHHGGDQAEEEEGQPLEQAELGELVEGGGEGGHDEGEHGERRWEGRGDG